jgi:hypothetical protein
MKAFFTTLIFAAVTAVSVVQAAPVEMTAADLYSFCNSHDHSMEQACRFYILGVVQGIGIGAGVANDKSHFCVPDDIPGSQLVETFKKTAEVLKKNFPTDMNSPAASIVGAAMVQKFPCK